MADFKLKLDPGNLGAIIRSAYFLGVDAIAFSTRNSAPFSSVALKASAGAAEYVPLLSVQSPVTFVDWSKKNEWRFFAAVAPDSSSASKQPPLSISHLKGELKDAPCILMLGGEGSGIQPMLQKRADRVVGVDGLRAGKGGVDSLNVSVAAALLCQGFLGNGRPPRSVASGDASRVF